jgi:vacuolar-type H+-ATPase subunit I/STV1
MAEESDKLIKPIRNASAPGTLAALCLAALKLGTEFPHALKMGLLIGAIMFLLSAFFVFFYSIYPTRKKLWTVTAVTFLLGLLSLVSSAVALLFTV